MVGATDSEQTLITWVVRLFYVSLFLPWMMAFSLWTVPITLPYLMGITILVITALRVASANEVWEELNDMYLEDISGYSTDI